VTVVTENGAENSVIGLTDVHDKSGQERHSILTDELVHKDVREFCSQNLWHQGTQ
jgi:hypothetical protein